MKQRSHSSKQFFFFHNFWTIFYVFYLKIDCSQYTSDSRFVAWSLQIFLSPLNSFEQVIFCFLEWRDQDTLHNAPRMYIVSLEFKTFLFYKIIILKFVYVLPSYRSKYKNHQDYIFLQYLKDSVEKRSSNLTEVHVPKFSIFCIKWRLFRSCSFNMIHQKANFISMTVIYLQRPFLWHHLL